MTITPYLGFDGNCREAFEFYAATFDASIEAMLTYSGSPMSGDVPEEEQDRIMHACLVTENAMLMGGDSPGGSYEAPHGVMVALGIPDATRAEAVFNALAEGGNVSMPFEEVFWVERFGMVTDRFGIHWAVNGGKSRMG